MKHFKPIDIQQAKQIGCVSVIALIVIAIISIFFLSACSTPESLSTPHHEDYMIVGIEKNKAIVPKPGVKIYEVDFTRKTTTKIKIAKGDTVKVGNYLICEFKNY